jgi:hypothetical protein
VYLGQFKPSNEGKVDSSPQVTKPKEKEEKVGPQSSSPADSKETVEDMGGKVGMTWLIPGHNKYKVMERIVLPNLSYIGHTDNRLVVEYNGTKLFCGSGPMSIVKLAHVILATGISDVDELYEAFGRKLGAEINIALSLIVPDVSNAFVLEEAQATDERRMKTQLSQLQKWDSIDLNKPSEDYEDKLKEYLNVAGRDQFKRTKVLKWYQKSKAHYAQKKSPTTLFPDVRKRLAESEANFAAQSGEEAYVDLDGSRSMIHVLKPLERKFERASGVETYDASQNSKQLFRDLQNALRTIANLRSTIDRLSGDNRKLRQALKKREHSS